MRVAEIHTSDRNFFRQCRRRWNWISPIREHLEKKERVKPLWFGTGWHFWLEDYHGLRVYPSPQDAWRDYVRATLDFYGEENLPIDWRDAMELGVKMIDHYLEWLKGRNPQKTFIFNDEPQVEVRFRIEIPFPEEQLAYWGVDQVVYVGTIDRVVEDMYGCLWVGEYKSAVRNEQMHFMSDPQVTAYMWAAPSVYGLPFAGCMYQQWRKDVPDEPTILKSGRISIAQNQKTTHRLYRKALINLYEKVENAPVENIDYLNYLVTMETEENDGFVRRDWITRSEHALQVEGVKILLEVADMLNPDLSLYPNPNRDCGKFCPLYDPCIALDDGEDWEYLLSIDFTKASEDQRGRDQWRQYLQHKVQPLHKSSRLQLSQDQQHLVQTVLPRAR